MPPLSPKDVFRDYNTPGVPASGDYEPDKAEIRKLLTQIAGGTSAVGDYRGAWSNATAYNATDIVSYGGSLWYAKAASTNVTPAENASWTIFLPGVTVADGSITVPKLASDTIALINSAGGLQSVATRTALGGATTGAGKTYLLLESGRVGLFTWDASNLSAGVTADPSKAVFVPPNSDTSGASGAFRRIIPGGDIEADWCGLLTGVDDFERTSAINRAVVLADYLGMSVHLPGRQIGVSAAAGYGIVLRTDVRIHGEGYMHTLLYVSGGGSLAQLRNYQAGSLFRRDFNISGSNTYVQNVLIERIGVVMNHPLSSITSTAIQIACDFRNITRSEIRDCWLGNYDPRPSVDTKGSSSVFLAQGYAFITGNESGASSYAGGEVNTIRDCFIAGAYRGVTIDDNLLNPTSAAYSTRVIENDIQLCQILIYQASQYGAANVFENNTLQATVKPSGNSADTFGIYIAGYGNIVNEAYGEYGNCQYILRLASTARNNLISYSGTCSVSSGLLQGFSDGSAANSYNVIEYFDNTGGAGTWNSGGARKRSSNGSVSTI